jgi:hypothetical protein
MKEKDRIGCCWGIAVTVTAVLLVVPVVWTVYEIWLRYGPCADDSDSGFSHVIRVDHEPELFVISGIAVILIVVLIAYIATRK